MEKNKENNIENVIKKYADMIYRIALTRCGTIENAEDVFQDVFLIYSKKMPKFKSKEHEKAWFIRVTINLSKNMKNINWNKKVISLDENIVFETKEEQDVFSVVCELPENYKTVIYLYYYEEYKVKEIATIMRINENTIKTWLSRAREILKDRIEGGFENE